MALKKQMVDIQVTDGLSQKISPEKLPAGKAATAINLVKNKVGQLEKRLGFAPIANTYLSTSFQQTTGITLSDFQGTLVGVHKGNFGGWATPPSVTALSTYSLDQSTWVYKGPLSDCNIVSDEVTSSSTQIAFSATDCIVNDYRIQVWIENTVGQAYGLVHWQIVECSTGNIMVPSQILDNTNNQATKVEIINTGTVVVVVYSMGTTLYVQTAATSSVPSPTMWSGASSLITGNKALSNNFEIAAVGGDSAHFLLAYGKTNAGNTDIVVTKWAFPIALTSTCTVVSNTGTPVASFGLRADTTDNIAFAYCQLASGSIDNPTAQHNISLAHITYSSMAISGSLTTNVYQGGTVTINSVNYYEYPPMYISIGKSNFSNAALWTAAWSPYNSRPCFNVPGANGIPGFLYFNNSRITALQWRGATTPTLTSNSTAGPGAATILQTYGVHLVSKFLEANNTLYCLGYLPSPTQGGYLILACDSCLNPSDNAGSAAYPMRPVGNIQTRTALSSINPSVNLGFTLNPTPCNFTSSGDSYNTSYLSYVSTAQGNKTMVCGGAIQFSPTAGYPTAKWGQLTCFGGALPSYFDGASVVEQNFLQCPESSNHAVMGTVNGITFDTGITIVPQSNSGGPFTFNSNSDSISYIFTYEQFDDLGNYHQSARSVAIEITGSQVASWLNANILNTVNCNFSITVPSLGATNRMANPSSNSSPLSVVPDSPVNVGVYRTGKSTGQFSKTYFRVQDPLYDGQSQITNGSALGKTVLSANIAASGSSFINFVDSLKEGNPATDTGDFLTNGVHPLLYGDGTNGAPGSLDDFCPPATPTLTRHKERLWVTRGNQILYTKQRGLALGPGYNEQVNVEYVGDEDSVVGTESLDDKFVVLKQKQLYYIGGDGPADDGSGNSFSQPQPIPTDSGCVEQRSVKTTPEGVYFMSEAGLRLLTRALAVEYAGGPVENEFGKYPFLIGTTLYPSNNKIIFLAAADDTANPVVGEWVNRDYVLDAWTTGLLNNANVCPVAATTAFANRLKAPSINSNQLEYVLHFMTKDGKVWRERDPLSAQPYYDNANYVSWLWKSPPMREVGDQARYRVYDVIPLINSADQHGLSIQVISDYNFNSTTFNWNWTQISSAKENLTQLRNYYGAMVEGAQISIQDVSDANSVTGQGAILLGCTIVIGVPGGNWKVAPGNTQ